MWQEEKKEKDSTALWIVWIQKFMDWKNMQKSKERQIKKKNSKTTIKKSRKQKWEEKQLYRYFKRQTKEIADKMSGIWLKKRNMER